MRVSLTSFVLPAQVLSSLVAAWDDIGRLMASMSSSGALIPISDADAAQSARTAAGYAWMMVNCLASAGYVLGMRKRIKVTNFKVWLHHLGMRGSGMQKLIFLFYTL